MRLDPMSPPTAEEVASSNNTLNALMGRRRKSWMTSASSGGIIRPSPRVQEPQPSQEATKTTTLPPTVLPSPAPSDEPSPLLRQSPASSTHISDSTATQTTILPSAPQMSSILQCEGTTSTSQTPPQPHIQASSLPSSRNGSVSAAQPLPANIETSLQSPSLSTTSAPEGASTERRDSGAAQFNSLQPPAQWPAAPLLQSPPKRTRPPGLDISLKPHVMLIDQHIAETGGIRGLDNNLEHPRFTLLREACLNDDSFYVALHQTFCVWTINPSIMKSIREFQGSHTNLAFRILAQFVMENNQISDRHLKFFASFPSPLLTLVSNSLQYRQSLTLVSRFLGKLVTEWAVFNGHCQQRGTPPLVDEMVSQLQLMSPTLQGIICTAMRRNIGIPDGGYGKKMEAIFTEDRNGHAQFSRRMNTDRPPSNREIAERNEGIVNRYRAIRSERDQLFASSPANSTGLHESLHSSSQATDTSLLPPVAIPSNIQPQTQRRSPSSAPLSGRPQESPAGHQIQPQLSYFPPTRQSGASDPRPFRFQNHSPQTMHAQMSSSLFAVVPSSNSSSNHVSQSLNPSSVQGHPQNGAHRVQAQGQAQVAHALQRRVSQSHPSTDVGRQNSESSINHPRHSFSAPHHGSPNQLRQQFAFANNSHMLGPIYQQSPSQDHGYQVVNGLRSQPGILSPPMTNSPQRASTPAGAHSNLMAPAMREELANIAKYDNQNPLQRQLVPPSGWQAPRVTSQPELTAIHQAHLASPPLRMATVEHLNGEPPMRHYQVVSGFAVVPFVMARNVRLFKKSFKVPEAAVQRMAKRFVKSNDPEEPFGVWEIPCRALRFRIRCTALRAGASTVNIPDWMVADCAWPSHLFVEINNQPIELRRKVHHGKDLPADVTSGINSTPDFEQNIEIAVLSQGGGDNSPVYAFAVECVDTVSHSQIMETVTRSKPLQIPATQTVAEIDAAINGGFDDDEIAIVASDISIGLADPYMARIFNVPVKGAQCRHRECFDLETFLNTRGQRPKAKPTEPCLIDVWKCPLCGEDARPYNLLVSEFMASVRAKLEADGNLDAKAILVGKNGQWQVKPEELPRKRSGVNDEDRDMEMKPKKRVMSGLDGNASSSGMSKQIEVIDLND